jgi:hypothetical protein
MKTHDFTWICQSSIIWHFPGSTLSNLLKGVLPQHASLPIGSCTVASIQMTSMNWPSILPIGPPALAKFCSYCSVAPTHNYGLPTQLWRVSRPINVSYGVFKYHIRPAMILPEVCCFTPCESHPTPSNRKHGRSTYKDRHYHWWG